VNLVRQQDQMDGVRGIIIFAVATMIVLGIATWLGV
jgi:hypothetical protein